MNSDQIVVAKDSFTITLEDGAERVVMKGETFHQDHAIVKGREELFKPFALDNEIETATSRPGSRRSGKKDKTPPAPNVDAADYSKLKQAQLKALLEERGIEYPNGVVSNAKLIELLEASGKAD